ncbi:hypothetical protein ACJMK2_027750 [Sinanodonta woodiana]|uniref:Uncharacterized protein n=1 Tax=Sinanodonta woodiana TaxID=1069815 RepID=A0ABD3X6D3_SINWO
MKLYKIPQVAADGVSNGKGACAVTCDTKSTSAQKVTMKPQADNHDQNKCSKHKSAKEMEPRPSSNNGLVIYERLISKETLAYALFLKSVIPVFEISNASRAIIRKFIYLVSHDKPFQIPGLQIY